jgi:hypothetical protein
MCDFDIKKYFLVKKVPLFFCFEYINVMHNENS